MKNRLLVFILLSADIAAAAPSSYSGPPALGEPDAVLEKLGDKAEEHLLKRLGDPNESPYFEGIVNRIHLRSVPLASKHAIAGLIQFIERELSGKNYYPHSRAVYEALLTLGEAGGARGLDYLEGLTSRKKLASLNCFGTVNPTESRESFLGGVMHALAVSHTNRAENILHRIRKNPPIKITQQKMFHDRINGFLLLNAKSPAPVDPAGPQ